MMDIDTIAAIATPPGRGGVGIVRISGPACAAIAQAILGKCPPPRQASYLPFFDDDGVVLDQGIALFFKSPHSFTGEDVLELQGHGGPVVMDMLLQRALALDARPARPGEFSQRAFLNDKLDLAQAEAVADLIDSASTGAARAALRSLQGEFSKAVAGIVEELIQLRVFVESAIDFPEEELDLLTETDVLKQLDALTARLTALMDRARQGCLLREGMSIIILGRPNAGKSSLLNVLVERPAAIVTDIAGTTRDIVREEMHIDGLPLRLIDTAGLRDGAGTVEQLGIKRAWQEVAKADHVLLVVDDHLGFSDEDQAILDKLPANLPVTLVFNKIDLSGAPPGLKKVGGREAIALSTRSGEGMIELRAKLKQSVGFGGVSEGVFMARRRHLDALRRAQLLVEAGRAQLTDARAGELLAEDLRQAQRALNEITGEFTADDLLGRIFETFCIGK